MQSILPAILYRRKLAVLKRERLEFDDGDFVDLDISEAGNDRCVIISHGLEGTSSDAMVLAIAALFQDRGWDVFAWNYRGCSGEPNRLPRSYHSGDTEDLSRIVDRASSKGCNQIALLGLSLGGNLSLKYLGEFCHDTRITGAVAISAPVDLAGSARKLDSDPQNRFYLRRLIKKLEAKIRCKAEQFPDIIPVDALAGIHGFADLDDRFTAPLHGFRDALDYWTRSSARPWIPHIRCRALLLSALDDPFLSASCFPIPEAQDHPSFFLETPPHGGHLGFIQNPIATFHYAELRAVEFLENLTETGA